MVVRTTVVAPDGNPRHDAFRTAIDWFFVSDRAIGDAAPVSGDGPVGAPGNGVETVHAEPTHNFMVMDFATDANSKIRFRYFLFVWKINDLMVPRGVAPGLRNVRWGMVGDESHRFSCHGPSYGRFRAVRSPGFIHSTVVGPVCP